MSSPQQPLRQSQQSRPNGASAPPGRGKTKMEKIAELEASLKLSKEENRRLKKEMQKKSATAGSLNSLGESEHFPHPSGRRSSSGGNTVTSIDNSNNMEKMKDALKALKRVTINQELSLQSLRAKASQRRSELEARDVTISKLQKQVASLRKANGTNNSSNASASSTNSQSDVIRRLQDGLMDEESKNVELTEKLQVAEARVKNLERQLELHTGMGSSSSSLNNPPASPLRMAPVFGRQNSLSSLKSAPTMTGSSASSGGTTTGGGTVAGDNQSVASGSTADFDFTKLKKELAKKSNRIVQLEYELEETKDELHQAKQQLRKQRHKQQDQGSKSSSKKDRSHSTAEICAQSSSGLFDADPFSNHQGFTASFDSNAFEDAAGARGLLDCLDIGDDDEYSEYHEEHTNHGDLDEWF